MTRMHQITLHELGIILEDVEQKGEPRKQYAFPCAGCICSHCANNVESSDRCAGKMKDPCFTCDYCRHYDGVGSDRRCKDCEKYIVTDEYAKRLRDYMKLLK